MRKTTILVILVLMLGNYNNKAAAQGLLTRLIEIKYTAELYLSSALKQVGSKNDGKDGEGSVGANAKDSALAIYNTLRWKVDGLVYQLSGDMVAANSPRKMRLLNEWCLQQPEVLIVANINESNKNKNIQTYTLALEEIETIYQTKIVNIIYAQTKTLNLTTNVFYLLKDSYSIVKGLSDMKTQKTMALIELLDHMRLLSPGEVAKQGK
ncbi:MAG: hypothetical protein NTW92_01845 [Bacteroidetes bacterium]|nr:hypothetical protein [Bacteroidota bacterium]